MELVKQMENIEVPETYAGEFEVELSREDAEGSWFFGDKELSPSSKYIMSSRRGRHTLSVKDVRKEDQGKYNFVCGDLKTSASLKMKRKPAQNTYIYPNKHFIFNILLIWVTYVNYFSQSDNVGYVYLRIRSI